MVQGWGRDGDKICAAGWGWIPVPVSLSSRDQPWAHEIFIFRTEKNLKFQDIFQDIRVTKTRFFVISGTYNVGTFRAEAKITIRRHEVVYRLSSERKMIDL